MKISIINKGRIHEKGMKAIFGGKDQCQSKFIGTLCLTVRVSCDDYFRHCKGVDGKNVCGGYPSDGHGSFLGPFECTNNTDTNFTFLCTTYKN